MYILISISKLLAGIGMFFFAMFHREESPKNLSRRNFKLFLQFITKYDLGAAGSFAVVTAILKCSSMVSLMVLAFARVRVFTMKITFITDGHYIFRLNSSRRIIIKKLII